MAFVFDEEMNLQEKTVFVVGEEITTGHIWILRRLAESRADMKKALEAIPWARNHKEAVSIAKAAIDRAEGREPEGEEL